MDDVVNGRVPALAAIVAATAAAIAQEPTPAVDETLEFARQTLQLPEQHIDLGSFALKIEKEIDPEIDVAVSLKQIDAIVAAIKSRLSATPSSREKLDALRTHLYQPGSWNGGNTFAYDMTDPMARNHRNSLVANYLATRNGNCVSMPILFIIIGQRLGLDVRAATAPEHVFVKYRDDDGVTHNLEATSGAGFARDEWLRRQMPMTDLALKNGVFMRPLTRAETVALLLTTLMEHFANEGDQGSRIQVAKFVLRHFPNHALSMLHLHGAYGRIIEHHFDRKYPSVQAIPPSQRQYYERFAREATHWRTKAESLGWRETDETSNKRYLERVRNAASSSERQRPQ